MELVGEEEQEVLTLTLTLLLNGRFWASVRDTFSRFMTFMIFTTFFTISF